MLKFWQKWMKPSVQCPWCDGKGKIPVFNVKDCSTRKVECLKCD